MGYENVKLWFARDENGDIVTIDEVNEIHSTYNCPVCGSSLLPKATESKKVTPHFAHVDASKCNGESHVHWWFKHKLIVPGDQFKVVSDKERIYICKEILVEQSYPTSFSEYRPDVTVTTETGETIYFEMAFSNKKKIKDYLDMWLELNNIVVEVNVKDLIQMTALPSYKSLFHKGKCFNLRKNDHYYNSIGKYKERICSEGISKDIKERLHKLDWFWVEVFNYRKDIRDIDYMVNLIDSIDNEDVEVVEEILNKKSCVSLYRNYLERKNEKLWNKLKEEIMNQYGEGYLKYIKEPYIQYDRYFGTNSYLDVYHEDDRCYYVSELKYKKADEILVSVLRTIKKNIEYNLIKEKINTHKEKANKIRQMISRLIIDKSLFQNIKDTYSVEFHVNDGNMNPSHPSSSFNFDFFKVNFYLKYKNGNCALREEMLLNETSNLEFYLLNISKRIEDFIFTIDPFKHTELIKLLSEELENKYKLFSLTAKYSVPFEDKGEIEIKIQNHHATNHHYYLPSYYFTNNDLYVEEGYKKISLSNDVSDWREVILKDVEKEIIKTFKNNCSDCDMEYTLSLGEASFFKRKALVFPKRCKQCRKQKKLERYL